MAMAMVAMTVSEKFAKFGRHISEEELSLFPQFSIVLVSRDSSEDKLCSVLIVCHPGVSRPHCTLGKLPVEN